MTLEQLRLFVAVAEREHMTRAAAALHRTQSAVSAAIAGLEAQSGVTLFHRVGRRIVLTDEGRAFLVEARAVVAQADAAERALADLAGMKRGLLSVMASQTIASYWLPPRLVAFRAVHPQVAVTASIGNTAEVAVAVAKGQAEIGLVEGEVADPMLEQTLVGHDRLVIVAAKDHPWTLKPPSPADLLKERWVLREKGSGTRSAFEAAIAEKGVEVAKLNISLELPSNEAVRLAVREGAGVSALSELVAEAGVRFGALAPVKFPLPVRAFHALRHRERYLSKSGAAFLESVQI
ncbi:MAG TPA: LysR substrate-binding domain-containing protein [Rhizomicrobium sp.]|jgi:DNA-binding transcriptional LysR family regulator